MSLEKNSDRFSQKMDDFDFDESDTIDILGLDISNEYKVKLIQNTEDSVIINNSGVAKKVVDILLNYGDIPLNYNVLQGLFSHLESLDNKIKLLLLYFDHLTDLEITTIVESLGSHFSKMFQSRKRPKFAHNELNFKLIQQLHKKGLISSYTSDKNEIKVSALYKQY